MQEDSPFKDGVYTPPKFDDVSRSLAFWFSGVMVLFAVSNDNPFSPSHVDVDGICSAAVT